MKEKMLKLFLLFIESSMRIYSVHLCDKNASLSLPVLFFRVFPYTIVLFYDSLFHSVTLIICNPKLIIYQDYAHGNTHRILPMFQE